MSQIWFERILRWRKKAQRFLQGRYAFKPNLAHLSSFFRALFFE